MSQPQMRSERLLELIETFGADPQTWPEEERSAALELLDSDPDPYQLALSQARALDEALTGLVIPEPAPDLAMRILADAPQGSSNAPMAGFWTQLGTALFPHGLRWPAGAALASLAMGLVGGYAYAGSGTGTSYADSAYYSAFGDTQSPDWLIGETAS